MSLPVRRLAAVFLALSFASALACELEGEEGDSDELPAVDCETVTVPRYEEMTVWNSCVGCHASSLDGDARQGAPADVNYDSYEDAVIDPFEAAEEVLEGEMPPSGPLSDEAMEQLNIWAQCGTPE